MDISVTVTSAAAKPFRMIDASYAFTDALGRRISSFNFDPDMHATPGEKIVHVSGYSGREMDRVFGMNREDVSVATCTKAIIYGDGSKDVFGPAS